MMHNSQRGLQTAKVRRYSRLQGTSVEEQTLDSRAPLETEIVNSYSKSSFTNLNVDLYCMDVSYRSM